MPIKLESLTNPLRFFFLWGVLGCATATANGTQQSVTIAVRESTVPLARGVGVTSFEVTVVATNDGPLPIYLSQCMSGAQRLIEKQWVTVYAPTCLGVDSYVKIARGDSAVFPMRVLGYTTGAPALDPRMTAGQYRLAFGIGVGASPLDNPQGLSSLVTVTSSPFLVRE
jgi:hypothetical protein